MKNFILFIVPLLLVNVVAGNRRGGFGNPQTLQRESWRAQSQNYNSDYDQDFDQNSGFESDNSGDIQQSVVDDDFEGVVGFGQSASAQYQTTTSKPSSLQSDSSRAPKYTQQGQPEIVTPMGTIRGNLVKMEGGKTIYSFLGIPFAKPPVEELKFKAPVPSGKFSGEFYYAVEQPNSCFQESFDIFNGFEGEAIWNPNTNVSEDCLYLNIWVSEEVVLGKKLVPVLFWIYGGGFFSGSNTLDIYNGAELASQENAVVVSSQYRVGPQGFLYFGTEDAPGNMGLLDQNLAIKWAHENIESFYGDPNLITLFGESAGSASVGYHLLLPESRSYFKRAVMMSGTPTSDYAIVHPNVLKNRSYKLAKLAGCDIRKSVKNITACLQKVETKVLARLQWNFYKEILKFPFAPTVDGEFLPDFPGNMLDHGDAKRADLMIGTVGNEGSYFVLYQYLKYFHHNKASSISHDRFIYMMKEIFADFSELELDAIINHYTNWVNPDDGLVNVQRISEAVGDYFFVCPVKRFADSWSIRGLKVYYYHFTQRTASNPWAQWMGVMHSDEIAYMFGKPLNSSWSFTPAEKQLSIYMMRLFSNFAKTGTPSDKWERYTIETPIYLDLNATNPTDETPDNVFGPRAQHCAFWNGFIPHLKSTAGSQMRQQSSRHSKRSQMMQQPSMQCDHQQAAYPEMPQHHKNACRNNNNRGVHGGQGFYVDNLDNCPQAAPARMQTPIPPAAPKNHGQNKPISGGFGRGNNEMPMPGPNGLPPCNSCCDNGEFTPSPIPV